MIDASALTADLARRQTLLVDDMRARSDADPTIRETLRAEHDAATKAERTAKTFTEWREDALAQSAAAWLISCAFVRFIEDNHLVPEPFIAGPGEGNRQANDRLQHHFATHPAAGHRDYLESVFTTIAALPGCSRLFDREHSALWRIGPSADVARDLWDALRRIDPEAGALVHDFTDPSLDTRFLGDLYQDLSEHAKKTFALLQTPVFVEEFILDRTLEPALAEFGLTETTVIDPACGSGHFLLGAFARLLDRYRTAEPGANRTDLVQRVLDQIAGVDLNPFAVAIARFRLLVAALKASGATRLDTAPDFRITLATGDSLLHGFGPPGTPREQGRLAINRHHYADEDPEAIAAILNRTYAVVVGNPPYITPKDAALNALYRQRFTSCRGKYSLAVPFFECFMSLAVSESESPEVPAGYVGMITANSFMTREFGARLVEEHMPHWDLQTIVDTTGAPIPGHGTPPVIIMLRNRRPVSDTVRVITSLRSETRSLEDPSLGGVWTSLVAAASGRQFSEKFVSSDAVPRGRLSRHPWTLAGGGVSELRSRIEAASSSTLSQHVRRVGQEAIAGEDDVFVRPRRSDLVRLGLTNEETANFALGDAVSDWQETPGAVCVHPISGCGTGTPSRAVHRALWPYRALLQNGLYFGRTRNERGLNWWQFAIVIGSPSSGAHSISFRELSTHGHFVIHTGQSIRNKSVQAVIPNDSLTDLYGLVGALNSSVVCFWLRQVAYNKGDSTDSRGARVSGRDPWVNTYQFNAKKVKIAPLPSPMPTSLGERLSHLGADRSALSPLELVARHGGDPHALRRGRREEEELLELSVSLQEELDWACYRAYGLLEEDLTLPIDEVPPINLGERAFEIVLARRMADGEETTAWFERHGSTPILEVPAHWPPAYRELVERRIAVIERDRDIALIERPEYKRRWAQEPWEKREQAALRNWLLDRLEARDLWPAEAPQARTVQSLADALVGDADARQVLELYAGTAADPVAVVRELIDSDCVPYLAAMRYTDAGLRKRAEWERVWDMQRAEDAITALTELSPDDSRYLTPTQAATRIARDVGDIPVPPKYARTDFAKASYWPLRGKLDVPKERFISYPTPEGDANPGALAVGWAGWDHVQRARALATRYTHGRDIDGWGPERLVPLLAGLVELLPWVRQWHPQVDPAMGQTVDEFLTGFIARECQAMGLTHDDLVAWRPPPPTKGRKKVTT